MNIPVRRLITVVIAVVLIAAIGRAALLASGAVSFHSDEAVVALMARHIGQGARPVFFYGQAYMGSLDAWLVAGGFALMGESVMTIRIVQSALYLAIVACGTIAAYRLSGRLGVALAAGLLLALPNTLVALYTTATLGGYNETLLIGCLIVILGAGAMNRARAGDPPRGGAYAAIGFLAGVGWWTNGLIVMVVAPVALVLLARMVADRRHAGRYLVPIGAAIALFFVGSAPWWTFNLDNEWAALRFYLPGGTPDSFAGGDVAPLPLDQRMIGLFLLGLPAVIGLRYPWASGYLFDPPLAAVLGFAALVITLSSLYTLVRRGHGLTRDGRAVMLLTLALFAVVFTLSRFSSDPTGRYFLPLTLVLAITIGAFAVSLPRAVGVTVIGVILALHTIGLVAAIRTNPPGVTTQFNLDTHLPNDDDAALIAFLTENGLTRGYANYWIAYRLAFLSGETLIYRAALPYKPDMGYTPRDDRYEPYVAAVEVARTQGASIAFITGGIIPVRDWLEGWLAGQGITYSRSAVGAYWVYYAFNSTPPAPPQQFTDRYP